ncbi:hypothetical protein LTR35_013282 [Friedmanniomyces endolithicus]|uniref:Helicase ATP-binding domain-containing protein n=1 Tax=Friedmanniomyces endolithicus TaxID=329885 RepID=A0AAN6J4T3_9PEZI|nr:hypothetical protein LTR35_013282 [Friedmanniomyces endolithicus]KAK0289283.1 hypothetical protein LTS00_009202 [Friedmanniomyces endolithicus]KAK0315279.1 hypothetical protein LTR82_012606 [Friedmanniomyces endolithicus]KAK0988161.1 hypothetical protein LTR54_012869 [Friedmanniomyces endolithicus]
MGMSKTLEAISAMVDLSKRYLGGFNLIVTTKACVNQWRDELFWNFEPEHRPRVLILEDPKMSPEELLDRGVESMILDEGHLIKNERSSTYKALKNIDARFVFTLTGALLVNRWIDAFGPISFLKNHPFDTRKRFSKAFCRGDISSVVAEPSRSKEARLVKFLPGVSRERNERQGEDIEGDEHDTG